MDYTSLIQTLMENLLFKVSLLFLFFSLYVRWPPHYWVIWKHKSDTTTRDRDPNQKGEKSLKM